MLQKSVDRRFYGLLREAGFIFTDKPDDIVWAVKKITDASREQLPFGFENGNPIDLSYFSWTNPAYPDQRICQLQFEQIRTEPFIFINDDRRDKPLVFVRPSDFVCAAAGISQTGPEEFFRTFDDCPRVTLTELANMVTRLSLPTLALQ